MNGVTYEKDDCLFKLCLSFTGYKLNKKPNGQYRKINCGIAGYKEGFKAYESKTMTRNPQQECDCIMLTDA